MSRHVTNTEPGRIKGQPTDQAAGHDRRIGPDAGHRTTSHRAVEAGRTDRPRAYDAVTELLRPRGRPSARRWTRAAPAAHDVDVARLTKSQVARMVRHYDDAPVDALAAALCTVLDLPEGTTWDALLDAAPLTTERRSALRACGERALDELLAELNELRSLGPG